MKDSKWMAAVTAAGVVLISACSSTEKRSEYLDAGQLPPLEVPPPLTSPVAPGALTVPELPPKKAPAATPTPSPAPASSPSPEAAPPSSMPAEKVGLPPLKGVQVERDGAIQWLVVEGSREQVWAKLKAYFSEYGPAIKDARSEFMTLDTAWAEPPSPKSDSIFRKVMSKLYAGDVQDKYRIRLEPGVRAGTVQVHVAHQGMAREAVEDNVKWLPSGSDAEKEIALLTKLAVYLGLPEEQAKALLSQPVEARFALVRDGGVPHLSVAAPQRWAWQRIGLALDRSETNVTLADYGRGIYEITYPVRLHNEDEDNWFVNSQAKVEQRPLTVKIEADGTGARVDVSGRNGAGAGADLVEDVLKTLLNQLD